MEEIYCVINDYTKDDSIIIEKMLDKFKKLIDKYAYLLKYEDAKNDLILHFIKLIKRLRSNNKIDSEAGIVSYIHKSIRNEYIRLSKEKCKNNYILDLTLENVKDLQENTKMNYLPEFLDKCLTKKEAYVIKMIYIEDYSVSDVSKKMDISRQAVNQCKNRSLLKLRDILTEDSSIFL